MREICTSGSVGGGSPVMSRRAAAYPTIPAGTAEYLSFARIPSDLGTGARRVGAGGR